MDRIDKVKWLSLISGVLLIITGILHIKYPIESTLGIVTMISALFIVLGFMRVIRYFNGGIFSTGSFLVGGILDIILGIIMIKNKPVTALAFTMLIGFWVLVSGISQIAASIDFKKIGMDYWWVDLLSGILGVILGMMLIGDFGLSALYINMMISIYMFIFGIGFIITFFNLNKYRNRF